MTTTTTANYRGWRGAGQGGDVPIHAVPIFHRHGLFVAIHGALINGSKMLWLSRFEPKVVIRRLPRATVFMGVPHADVGAVGVVVLVPRAGALLDAGQILAQLKSSVTKYKVPNQCFVLPELARNAMGKAQKNLLRAHYGGPLKAQALAAGRCSTTAARRVHRRRECQWWCQVWLRYK